MYKTERLTSTWRIGCSALAALAVYVLMWFGLMFGGVLVAASSAAAASTKLLAERSAEISAASLPKGPEDAVGGDRLFQIHCAACHANGGNIIRRGKNLKQKALTRYGYADAEAIQTLVRQGKGAMPAYGDRLGEDEIGAIAQYVLSQAKIGW